VHVKAVSERLGHSSTSFTMDTYQAVIPSMGRAAADAADQLFGEGQGDVQEAQGAAPENERASADGKLTATTPSSVSPERRLRW
jgi:hypothetical protein